MYATVSDMRSRFDTSELIQLTDEARLGVIDDTKLTAALTDASQLVDSYVAAQYALPLTTVPAILVQMTCEVARYNLYRDAPADSVQRKYDDAIKWLRSLSDGRTKLQIAGAEVAPQTDMILTSGPDRVFNRDSLRGF